MRINGLPTVNAQDILYDHNQHPSLLPAISTHHSTQVSGQGIFITHLRTSTKSNNQIDLSLQTNILALLASWRVKTEGSSILVDWNVHEQIERRGSELWCFETYTKDVSI